MSKRIESRTATLGRGALAMLLLAATPGCGALQVRPGAAAPAGLDSGTLISAEDIARSRATTAWEALQRGRTHLMLSESGAGQPLHASRRGSGSLDRGAAPLVVVDGVRVAGIDILRDIPAHDIASIRVLGGVDATRLYGTGGGNGAIVIRTRTGPQR